MTAIAWAIATIGLIFYDAIYREELAARDLGHPLGSIIIGAIVILFICTIRELLR